MFKSINQRHFISILAALIMKRVFALYNAIPTFNLIYCEYIECMQFQTNVERKETGKVGEDNLPERE